MFDQDDHPSVPTWPPPDRGAQGRSRMPPAAPAKPARPRPPRAQRYADLPETPIPPAPAGLPPRQKPLNTDLPLLGRSTNAKDCPNPVIALVEPRTAQL